MKWVILHICFAAALAAEEIPRKTFSRNKSKYIFVNGSIASSKVEIIFYS
jgi:hypothetical protein